MGADVVSIELLFDDATERLVRAEWDALAAAGVSSMAAHTSPTNRPHVTALVRPSLTPFDADAVVARLPLPVTLGSPMLFVGGSGDRRIVVRSVVVTADLLALHAAVHQAAGPGEDAAHTAPGSWTPHVTLSRRLKLADLPIALGAIGDDIVGSITAIRRWDAASKTVTDLG